MRLVAFDLSLTATGYACYDDDGSSASGVFVPPKPFAHGMARLQWIRHAVLRFALGAEFAAVEGYSFGAKGNAILSLAELGGVIRVALADALLPYVDVPPASLKLFATGKGNAPKDQVLAEAIKRLGYDGHDHNEADALWLLQMARASVGAALTANDAQRRALAKPLWPTLAVGDSLVRVRHSRKGQTATA